MRPLATKLTPRMSCSARNDPVTRMSSFSSPVWTTPAGVTAFWACRADISACRLIPKPAICSVENST